MHYRTPVLLLLDQVCLAIYSKGDSDHFPCDRVFSLTEDGYVRLTGY
jgi:hypothetical protein